MFYADLHVHSYLSRATAKDLDLEHLNYWAQLKGISVVGTGDITHPEMLAQIQQKLEPTGNGLFTLKREYAESIKDPLPAGCKQKVYFMLQGEISTIYKAKGSTRKIHHVVCFPDIESVRKLQTILKGLGNITSDGRPILGLDSRKLLEIALECCPDVLFIPAHIWTPWFSALGSKSGFDSIEDCYGDLSEHIYAVETGLSSDPPMNWMLSSLDKYRLISNSDAHSPAKLGREANIFDCELSYLSIVEALKTGTGFHGTIEFFPEEGKYHYDGHRKCHKRMEPLETIKQNGRCPSCGKPVTIGVLHRVFELGDRRYGYKPEQAAPYRSLVSLESIICEVLGLKSATRKVKSLYHNIIERFGSEYQVLMDADLDRLSSNYGDLLAEGISRVREGRLHIEAGYDGEFGTINIFTPQERASFATKTSLGQTMDRAAQATRYEKQNKKREDLQTQKLTISAHTKKVQMEIPLSNPDELLANLNPEQRAAATYFEGPLLIVAGPGTGKTLTVTHRIAYMIMQGALRAENVLAVTFTNKASQEMRERLSRLLGGTDDADRLTIATFHRFCLNLLLNNKESAGLEDNFSILDDTKRDELLKGLKRAMLSKEVMLSADDIGNTISHYKQRIVYPEYNSLVDKDFFPIYQAYQNILLQENSIDFDDLIAKSVLLLQENPKILEEYQHRFSSITVDEYQDINQAQYRLTKLLAGNGKGLCAIGDPNQAIYGFRGADRSYFNRFRSDYPTTKVIPLTTNYRSTKIILEASRHVMSKSQDCLDTRLETVIKEGARINICPCASDRQEAEQVVHTIERLVGGTRFFSMDSGRSEGHESMQDLGFKDIAVLYRLRTQGACLQEAFDRSGIPYQIIKEKALNLTPEDRLLHSLINLLYNPKSRYHFLNILASPLVGLSPKEIDQVKNDLFWGIRCHRWEIKYPKKSWKLDKFKSANLVELGKIMESLARSSINNTPGVLLMDIHRIIKEKIKLRGDASFYGKSNESISRLLPLAKSCKTLGELVHWLALHQEIDNLDFTADKVSLLTLHAAKGLEFQVVFMVGCEEGILPLGLDDLKMDADPEEERRLFYVGMTRPKQLLYISYVQKRRLYGKLRELSPSTFLDDVKDSLKKYIATTHRSNKRKPKDRFKPLSIFDFIEDK